MKKTLSLVLALILVMSAIPLFSYAEDVPVFKITAEANALVTDFEDNYLTKWIEDTFGCKIEWQLLPAGNEYANKLSVMMAGEEDLGDLVIAGSGVNRTKVNTWGENGALVDMAPFFTDGTTNLEKLCAELGQDILGANKNSAGAMYGYPYYQPEENNMTQYRAWINTTWLDNLNLEMPTTPDELYNVLKAFKEQDANGNGDPNDEIPMLGSTATASGGNPTVFLTNPFVYWDAGEGLNVEDGKVYAAFASEGFREALRFMNKLINEGLLVADSFTISNGQYREYLSTETPIVGVLTYTHLGYVGPTDENKKQYQYLPYLFGSDGVQRVAYVPYASAGTVAYMIPTSAKDVNASFALADWLFSEESYIRGRYGVEGVHYDAERDPEILKSIGCDHPYAIIERSDVGWSLSCNMSWHRGLGYFTGASWSCTWNGDPDYYFYKRAVAVRDMLDHKPAEGEYLPVDLIYTEEETERYTELKANISNYWSECKESFILGTMDIETQWDEYINTLTNEMNLDEYLELVQGAYDRYIAAK